MTDLTKTRKCPEPAVASAIILANNTEFTEEIKSDDRVCYQEYIIKRVSYCTIVLYYSCMKTFRPLNLIIHECDM